MTFSYRPTSINERPSQTRTGEGGSSGIWHPRSERSSELRESPRESTRGFGTSTQQGSSRADTAENWRSREKKRMNRLVLLPFACVHSIL